MRLRELELSWVIVPIKDLYKLPKSMSGVYSIFFDPILPNKQIIAVARYVGESGDCIKGRIRAHIREKGYGLESYVAFAEIKEPDPWKGEETRKGVERFLYNRYKPLDTKKSPNVPSIAVVLPVVEYLEGWKFYWIIAQEAVAPST